MHTLKFLCLLLTLLALPVTALSAEFRVAGFPGSLKLRIHGTIEPGDRDKLNELLQQEIDGILINSNRGDLADSMAIGQLIREALLPVTAVENCGSSCILIWVAGIQRTTRTALDPRDLAAAENEVRSYLRDMEIDDAAIAQLLDSAEPLAPGQAHELLGTKSPGHESRLAERCGTLSAKQKTDWQAIQSLAAVDSALNAMTTGMGGGQAMYVVDPETERQASAARNLSPDYRRELEAKQAEIETCKTAAVAEWRKTAADESAE